MIGRTHRFHGHGSLRYVYQRGQTTRGPALAVRYALNERRKDYRVAVVVSKKVSKSAVVRNRIRRRIYEQIRLLEPHITQPADLVISVFSDSLATMPSSELASLVRQQLKQAKILTADSTPVHGKIEAKGE
jgi:ribonuclease P protein component